MMTFNESVGVIVKSGLLDIDKVYSLLAGAIRQAWERCEPLIMGDRELFSKYNPHGKKSTWDGFEFLYNEILRYDQQEPELNT